MTLDEVADAVDAIRADLDRLSADATTHEWAPYSPKWERAFGEMIGLRRALKYISSEREALKPARLNNNYTIRIAHPLLRPGLVLETQASARNVTRVVKDTLERVREINGA